MAGGERRISPPLSRTGAGLSTLGLTAPGARAIRPLRRGRGSDNLQTNRNQQPRNLPHKNSIVFSNIGGQFLEQKKRGILLAGRVLGSSRPAVRDPLTRPAEMLSGGELFDFVIGE